MATASSIRMKTGLLVTYVPAFSLALPRLFMGYAH